MFPVLIKVGPITVHTYGFMMALGVAFAIWFMYIQAKKQGLNASKLIDMVFYTIILALLGAKAVLLVSNFSYYTSNPAELLSLARSGGVFQGGLVVGIVFALFYMRKHKLPTWKTGDILAPALALGHALGRIGCFCAGCCYGRPTTSALGVEFHDHYAHNLTGIPIDQAIHPVQLYESILNFINFIFLFLVLKKKKFDGQVFSLYIINYSFIRYFTEFYRGDHANNVFFVRNVSPYLSISYPQVFCIMGLIAGFILFFVFKKRKVA